MSDQFRAVYKAPSVGVRLLLSTLLLEAWLASCVHELFTYKLLFSSPSVCVCQCNSILFLCVVSRQSSSFFFYSILFTS